jgi:hypothetical protein
MSAVLRHKTNTWNFEVALRFLENLKLYDLDIFVPVLRTRLSYKKLDH